MWEGEALSGHNGGSRDSEALSQASGDWTLQLAKPGCYMHLLGTHRQQRLWWMLVREPLDQSGTELVCLPLM